MLKGIPQVSYIEPFLFDVFMNDLICVLKNYAGNNTCHKIAIPLNRYKMF